MAARSADAAEKRARVVQMRRARLSFAEIGRREGVTEQRAWQIYQAALKAIPTPAVNEHRAEELILVDDALRALMTITTDKTISPRTRVEAWNSIRSWAEHKAKLLGLNAPVKVEVTDAIDADIERLVAELAGLAPGGEAATAGAPGAGGGETETA